MRVMAFFRLCLFIALNFAAWSLQATKDPLNDFCRRWGHQTAQVDGKLYVDGGQVAWNPLSSNAVNTTNTWLLYSDLNSTTQDVGMPKQYANLSKPSTVPSVSGGVLWADEVNKCFYLYGGEYQNNPSDFSFWTYDTILNQWNETKYTSNVNSIQRVSHGSGTQIGELGVGYYYGGWLNNQTAPGWSGPPMATSNLIRYDYTAGTLNNNTGPDSTGRAEGQMVYLPASDGGLLVYFGGVEDPDRNGSFVGANMSTIHIFDVSSSKWYSQTASGAVPAARRQFCADVTWADDQSSYNIYLYGGFGIENATGYDDAYILSLPSFTWIKAWPTDNNTQPYPHGGCTANVVNRDQMIVLGGWFPTADVCDSPNSQGQHNMNLGYNGPANTLWDKYDPKVDTYFVPTPVISAIGGGPTGGATATKPATWDSPDLGIYFTRKASFSERAATRSIPTSTGNPSGGGTKKTNVGAIAGGVVGGLVALIAILSLILFCLHRRKKAQKNGEKDKTPSPPPAELAATPSVHELSSPGTGKYLAMNQQPDSNAHPAYSGANSPHSHSASYDHHSPHNSYQHPYGSTSPTTTSYPSHYTNEYPQAYQQQPYPPYSDNPSAYDTHNTAYDPHIYAPPPSAAAVQRQYSYPTPISPTHPPFAPVTQPQVYYPPPPDPSIHSRSHNSFSDRVGSPEGTQRSVGSDNAPIPPSTTNTPAQFYAQPVPVSPQSAHVMSGGAGLSPGGYGGEGGSPSLRSTGDDGSYAGSIDSRRRPVRGRFVEVDHM